MGRVHLARQCSLEREVAVKTIKPGASGAASQALLREARLTGALEHPGVVPIHLLTFDPFARPMLVMKRVDGVDLETLLADREHPAWKARGRSTDRFVAALEILLQVCLTLEFAHSRGIVHRDVKPKNIMVGSFGEVYLLDWGIATAMDEVESGDLVGTPSSLPPEMALGQRSDQRTDVYLLGATLHEILTGQSRHLGATIHETLQAAIASEPFTYPESVPQELANLCNRATARRPEARPASVEELREEISTFIRSRSSRALNDAALERVADLEALLGPPGVPRELARAYLLASEARFGFALNLREHAGDPTARSGMRRCLALAVELELRQGQAESAEAILREMDVSDPTLAKRIQDVREHTTKHARDRDRLQRLLDELDPTQHSWQRSAFLLTFWLFALVVIGRKITLGGSISPERVAAGSAFTTALYCWSLFVIRRRIAWNAFNKQLIVITFCGMMTVVVHRLIAVVYQTPASETMTIDLVIMSGMGAFAAYALIHRLVLAGIPLVIGVGAALLWPSQAPLIAVAAVGAAAPIAALVLKMTHQSGGVYPPR
jgi:serine/threonine-protein kinase